MTRILVVDDAVDLRSAGFFVSGFIRYPGTRAGEAWETTEAGYCMDGE